MNHNYKKLQIKNELFLQLLNASRIFIEYNVLMRSTETRERLP